MAEGEYTGSHRETQVTSEGAGEAGMMDKRHVDSMRAGSGEAGVMDKLHVYLTLAKECVETVRGMPSRNFNAEQCGYLAYKLEAVVESASLFLEESQAQPRRSCSSVDTARKLDIFELILALAKQIKSFVQGCCKEAWMHAAMTLANVGEYVSSLGFNLELCRIALAGIGGLTLDEIGKVNKDEVEVVEKKALTDSNSLLKKATLELNSSKAEDCILAKYLLHKLVKVVPNPTSDDSKIVVKLFEWVTSGKKPEQVGRGASATVYKVMWLGTAVAKKTFHGPENQEFLQEVQILSQLCHPNITSMFCCNMNKRSCSIIMELMDGNLQDMMQSRLEKNSGSPPFTILEGVDIMLQVGEGVNYLHSKKIVHRDLKSMNILVKSVEGSSLEVGYVQAKVVDFGLSRTKERSTTYSNMTYNTGTFRWMAPELINIIEGDGRGSAQSTKLPKHKFKCDIYSFGMVCFEILSGEVPFNCENIPRVVKEKVLNGLRPKIPNYCPSRLKCLIEKCWSQEPMERPTIGDVCLELKYLKYLLMTRRMAHECHTFGMKEPFEVVHLNMKSLPKAKQIQLNIFSPILKELLSVFHGKESIDGQELFYNYEKVMERYEYCVAKFDLLETSSSMDANHILQELQQITYLVHFMEKEFVEIKSMYKAMESNRRVTFEMLWAFFPPRERVVYLDKHTNKHVYGEVLRIDYEETFEGPILLVKVTQECLRSQTLSEYVNNKIPRFIFKKREKKVKNKFIHTITIHGFEGEHPFRSLNICLVRFMEGPKAIDESYLLYGKMSFKELQEHSGPLIIGGVRYAIQAFHRNAQEDSIFFSWISLVSRLKHENMVELIGCCMDEETILMVYEYATTGSLHDILHERELGDQNVPVLDWIQRVQIAVEAARGLEYLHNEGQPCIIHRSINSSNIRLFDSYLAKIGIMQFRCAMPYEIGPAPIEKLRVLYQCNNDLPPEWMSLNMFTQKSDVYSFGVVLLELLTGQEPQSNGDDRSLKTWACSKICENKVREIIDPKLEFKYSLNGVTKMAAVAAMCLQEEECSRPSMSIVVKALEELLSAQYADQVDSVGLVYSSLRGIFKTW